MDGVASNELKDINGVVNSSHLWFPYPSYDHTQPRHNQLCTSKELLIKSRPTCNLSYFLFLTTVTEFIFLSYIPSYTWTMTAMIILLFFVPSRVTALQPEAENNYLQVVNMHNHDSNAVIKDNIHSETCFFEGRGVMGIMGLCSRRCCRGYGLSFLV